MKSMKSMKSIKSMKSMKSIKSIKSIKNMFLGLEKFLAKWTFINVHFAIVPINIEKKREKMSCD
jgi:hypothetical protein